MACDSAKRILRACADGGSDRDWWDFQRLFEDWMVNGIRRAFRRAGRLPSADDVEDLLQDTYCKLLEKNGRVLNRCTSDRELAIGVYLGRVAERTALDQLRAVAAQKRGGGKVDSLESVNDRDGDRWWPTVEADAERRILREELRERFLEACRRVAGRSRERNVRILRLAFLDGLSSAEISRKLGDVISIAGIDTILHRARRRLAEQGFPCGRRRLIRGEMPA